MRSRRAISLGLVPAESRQVRPVPQELLALVPAPTDNNTTLKSSTPDVERDTMPVIIDKARRTRWQTRRLAQALKGSTLEETLRNNSNFILKYIRYTKDHPDHEQIRSPRRLIHEGQGDCDCFAVTLASLLLNQGITFRFRIAQYPTSGGEWSHIYVVVPRDQRNTSTSLTKREDYIVLDPVTNLHNHEAAYTRKRDYTMALQYLDGTPGRRLGECPPKETSSTSSSAAPSTADRQTPIAMLPGQTLSDTNRKATVDILEAMDIPYQYNIDENNNPMVMVSDPRFVEQGLVQFPTVVNDTTAGLLTRVGSQPLPDQATPGVPVSAGPSRVAIALGILGAGGLLWWAFSGSKPKARAQLSGPVRAQRKKLSVLHI